MILFSLVQGYGIFATYILRQELLEGTNFTIHALFNSVLGMPYYQEDAFRNDAPDIIKFTEKDWMNFRCQPVVWERELSKSGPSLYFKGNSDKLPYRIFENYTYEKRLQLNCLGVRGVLPYGKNLSVNGELCTNYFNCQLVNIVVKDYVFDHPDILWNMIKIAERPCDYIKTKAEAKDEKEERLIASDRRKLHCDGVKDPWYMRERKYILITVWNSSESKQMADILVRRKDL